MDHIPLEVFNAITSYLTCSEKRKLLLVCRHWYNVIRNTNLFSEFSVKGKSRFEAASSFFENANQYERQVRSLRLTKPEADLQTILAIPERFPYLEDLVWADYRNIDYDQTPVQENQVQGWKHIKSFEEINRHALTTEILRTGVLQHLNRLKINFHFGFSDCNSLFEQLAHAPQLQRLELTCVSINLLALEKLHRHAKQLHTLCLTDIAQNPGDFDDAYETTQEELANMNEVETQRLPLLMDQLTLPAKGLTHLQIRRIRLDNSDFGLERRWMTYIAKKYTDLEELTLDGLGMARERLPYYEERLVNIAAACPRLQSYNVHLLPLTSNILNAIDQHGAQLRHLDIVHDPEQQLKDLLNSQQKQYIESMNITGAVSETNSLLQLLSQLPKLKVLQMDGNGKFHVPLDVLLKGLTSLESLVLSACEIGLNNVQEKKEDGCYRFKLRSLVLKKAHIMTSSSNDPVDAMAFVSHSCPYLSKLEVHGTIVDTLRPFKIHFPGHYFSSIKVYILRSEIYKVDNGRRVTWYRFKPKSLQEIANFQSDLFHVSIVYRGLTSLSIGGTDIPNW